MSVKSERVFWVECDWSGCTVEATDVEGSPWVDAAEAIWAAEYRDWRQVDLGVWLCPAHQEGE
jgi:hypothetical protein